MISASDDKCPICKGPVTASCKCPRNERRCAGGHHWRRGEQDEAILCGTNHKDLPFAEQLPPEMDPILLTCKQVITDLLTALPDSPHPEHTSWAYCWEELDTDFQDFVKLVRTKANKALALLKPFLEGCPFDHDNHCTAAACYSNQHCGARDVHGAPRYV